MHACVFQLRKGIKRSTADAGVAGEIGFCRDLFNRSERIIMRAKSIILAAATGLFACSCCDRSPRSRSLDCHIDDDKAQFAYRRLHDDIEHGEGT